MKQWLTNLFFPPILKTNPLPEESKELAMFYFQVVFKAGLIWGVIIFLATFGICYWASHASIAAIVAVSLLTGSLTAFVGVPLYGLDNKTR